MRNYLHFMTRNVQNESEKSEEIERYILFRRFAFHAGDILLNPV